MSSFSRARSAVLAVTLVTTSGLAVSPRAWAVPHFVAGLTWSETVEIPNESTTHTGDMKADDHPDTAHAILSHAGSTVALVVEESTGEATAGRQGLGVLQNSHLIVPVTPPAITFDTDAAALMVFDDLRFTGPAGATSVSASLNVRIDALLSVDAVNFAAGENDLKVACALGDHAAIDLFVSDFPEPNEDPGIEIVPSGVVVMHNISADETDHSASMTTVDGDFAACAASVPLGAPVTLTLELEMRGTTVAHLGELDPTSSILLSGDAFHTLKLPSTGPVFNLPPGYSVSSDSGLIVDNLLVTTATTTSSTTTTTLVGNTTSTTTTTLPGAGCGDRSGIDVIDCECAAGIPSVCAGLALPASVTNGFPKACATADSAASATGKKARRGFGHASKRFGKLGRTVGKHKVARKLSPNCVAALQVLFDDLHARVGTLRQ